MKRRPIEKPVRRVNWNKECPITADKGRQRKTDKLARSKWPSWNLIFETKNTV